MQKRGISDNVAEIRRKANGCGKRTRNNTLNRTPNRLKKLSSKQKNFTPTRQQSDPDAKRKCKVTHGQIRVTYCSGKASDEAGNAQNETAPTLVGAVYLFTED